MDMISERLYNNSEFYKTNPNARMNGAYSSGSSKLNTVFDIEDLCNLGK